MTLAVSWWLILDLRSKVDNFIQKIQYAKQDDPAWFNITDKPRAWNEYSQTLFVSPTKEHKTFANAHDHLVPDEIIKDLERWGIIRTAPQLMVGLGIFGTFLGLSFGLYDLNISELDQIQDSIKVLIEGMKTAFYTSVVGMFCSLLFLLIERVCSSAMEKKLRQNNAFLNERFLLKGEEQVAVQNEGFVESMDQVFNNLKANINTIMGEFRSVMTEVVSSLFEPIEKIQTHSESLADQIQQLGNELKTLPENMSEARKAYERIQRNFADLVEQFASTIESQHSTLKEWGLITNMIQTSTSKIEALIVAMDSFISTSENLSHSHEDLSHELQRMLDEQAALTRTASDLVAALKDLPVSTETSLASIFAKIDLSTTKTTAAFEKNMNAATLSLKDQMTGILSNIREAMPTALKSMESHISAIKKDLQEVHQEIVSQYLESFTHSVEVLSNNIDNMNRMTESLEDLLKSQYDQTLHTNNTNPTKSA